MHKEVNKKIRLSCIINKNILGSDSDNMKDINSISCIERFIKYFDSKEEIK